MDHCWVITTFTLSPLAKVDAVNTLLFVPAFTPFTIHWYVGVVPPLVGVAVKVTEPPEHIDTVVGVIDTDGVTLPTVTVTSLLVAVAGDAHGSLLVITTFTLSPLAKVDEVNTLLFVPAFTPFTIHWYVGVVPPLVGVAVKVTDVPAQIAPEGTAAVLTLTGNKLMINETLADVASGPPDPETTTL